MNRFSFVGSISLVATLTSACAPVLTQLSAPKHSFAGREPAFIIPGDFNGDGKNDLVMSRQAGTGELVVLLGKGNGAFDAMPAIVGNNTAVRNACVTDLNGDGKPDLAVSDLIVGGFVSVLIGNGDGTFAAPLHHLLGKSAVAVKAGDFNGDGKTDLITVNTRPESSSGIAEYLGGQLSILLGKGDGTFMATTTRTLGQSPRSLAIGDYNGDGKSDIAVADPTARYVYILAGRGDGSFDQVSKFTANPISLTNADVNKDGRADLLAAYAGGIEIYTGSGNGTFSRNGSYELGAGRSSWAVDLDKDGHVDIISAQRYLHNDGTGKFTVEQVPGQEYADSFVTSADFNGDGWPDLAAADREHNRLSVYLNVGGRSGKSAPASKDDEARANE